MTRIRGHEAEVDWDTLVALADTLKRRIIMRCALCEHGRTPNQTCRNCEGGYVQDTSVYAKLPWRMLAVAVMDDGAAVGFLKERVDDVFSRDVFEARGLMSKAVQDRLYSFRHITPVRRQG